MPALKIRCEVQLEASPAVFSHQTSSLLAVLIASTSRSPSPSMSPGKWKGVSPGVTEMSLRDQALPSPAVFS